MICGGTACLAGAFVLAVAARNIGQEGLPLLLALLYPLIDIVLGLLVVAQIALRTRGRVRDSAGLLIGFALLATADSGFLLHLSNGTYDYSILSVDLWGAAFAPDRRQRLPRAHRGPRGRPAGAASRPSSSPRHGRGVRARLRTARDDPHLPARAGPGHARRRRRPRSCSRSGRPTAPPRRSLCPAATT